MVGYKMARDGAGIRKATENSIQIEFTYQSQRCRERIKCAPTPANFRKIALFRETILNEIESGTFDYAKTFPDSKRATEFIEKKDHVLLVSDCLNIWLDEKEKQTKASTYNTYRKKKEILAKIFGHFPAEEIKKVDVKDWCKTLTIRNKSIKGYIKPLVAALQLAADDERIKSNPLAGFKYAILEEPQEDFVDPLDRDEAAKLLSFLTGQYKNLVQFALWTGVRTSELIAVQWGDVDFNRGTILIKRAKTQVSKKDEKTKTKTGTREVKLLSPALSALISQKTFTFLSGQHIFLNEKTGKPFDGDHQIRIAWVRALLRAGIRYRNPYQTRHTYASWMLSAGESLPWISKQMGHSSVTTTTTHYARFISDSQPDAGNKAVNLFSEKTSIKTSINKK
jgi:integrase